MLSLRERFESKVDRRGPDECWPWLRSCGTAGYGQFRVGRTVTTAHRVAYELYIGPIPEGYVIDHVRERGCQGGRCCNPAHLEAVTRGENTRRQWVAGHDWHAQVEAAVAARRAKTHCRHGHEYTDENTYRYRDWRYCRACRRERDHARNTD